MRETGQGHLSTDRLSEALNGKYPDLTVTSEDGVFFVRGSFPIIFEGDTLDRYLIELKIQQSFPNSVPTLREIGGRIPATADWHTSSDGESCPLVPEEWLLLPFEERTLVAFLEVPVRNFLLCQALKERGKPWPHGERSHARLGLLEAYSEMLGISDKDSVQRYLDCLRSKKIKGHWPCPCGSGLKLRDCHPEQIREMQTRIPRKIAASALSRLKATRW